MTLCINWAICLSVISAIAAISGVWVAIFSWKQMIDVRKARLIISVKSFEDIFFLEVRNVGQNPACDITFKMNDNFFNYIIENLKSAYTNVEINSFKLNGGDFKLFYILPVDENYSLDENGRVLSLDEMKCLKCKFLKTRVKIIGKYLETYCNKVVNIDEEFNISDYITNSAAIPDRKTILLKSIEKSIKTFNIHSQHSKIK